MTTIDVNAPAPAKQPTVPMLGAFAAGIVVALGAAWALGAFHDGGTQASSYRAVVRNISTNAGRVSLCASPKPTGDASCERPLLEPNQPLPQVGDSVFITKLFVPIKEDGSLSNGYFLIPRPDQ